MSRKEFRRKPNTFAPILVNDGYSNFRFSKRAGEILSPLNKTKLGFNARVQIRKMTLNPKNYRSELKKSTYNGGGTAGTKEMNMTSYSRLGENSLRGASMGTK